MHSPGMAARARQLRRAIGVCLPAVLALGTGVARPADLPLVDVLRELDGPGGMDTVDRVQILQIDYAAQYRAAVSEHFIEQNAEQRCVMPFTAVRRTDFLLALHAARPRDSTQGADLRWSAIFLDRQGIPLHRLSVNGRYFLVGLGRLGYLDGIGVAFEPGMGAWFERTMTDCRMVSRHD